MKSILIMIKYEIMYINKTFLLWKMKRRAKNLHKITGKRYHVIPVQNGELVVVDNSFIDKYNKLIKNKSKKITIEKLIRMSFYSTSVKGFAK